MSDAEREAFNRLTQKIKVAREGFARFAVILGEHGRKAILDFTAAFYPMLADGLYQKALVAPTRITPDEWDQMNRLARWADENDRPVLAQKMCFALETVIDHLPEIKPPESDADD